MAQRMKHVHIAGLIIVAFVLLALLTTAAIPPLEASDEAAHYLYVHNLLEDRALPVIPTRDEINAIAARGDVVGQWSIESHQPPAYYLIGALLISPTDRSAIADILRPNELIFTRGLPEHNANKWLHSPAPPTDDSLTALYILRFYSLTLSALTLWLIYRAGLLLTGSAWVGLGAMLLTATIPTFVSIGSSVNNDNLVTLLYTAGVVLLLRMWNYGIDKWNTALLSGVLGVIALTKITGLSLFAVVVVGLALGVWRGRFSRREALRVFGAALAVTAVVAGWWYLRNWSLYGDPLALDATQRLWGREFANAAESGDIANEISRIWRSFWMMTGHLHNPVYGPTWFYIYTVVITLIGVIGLMWGAVRRRLPISRELFLLLLSVIGVMVFLLAWGTRTVDISYGRLLFPALVAFAPLVVVGWRRLLGRGALLLTLPLALMVVTAAVRILPESYPLLQPIDNAVLREAVPVDYTVATLTLVAYEALTETVAPGESMQFDLYLAGVHRDNAALFITVIDPVTQTDLGTMAVYPGSAPTDAIPLEHLYRARITVPVEMPEEPLRPRALQIQLGWQTILDTTRYLPMVRDGVFVDTILLGAATLIDPRYSPTAPENALEDAPEGVTFGGVIGLDGYAVGAQLAASPDAPHPQISAELPPSPTGGEEEQNTDVEAQSTLADTSQPTSVGAQLAASPDGDESITINRGDSLDIGLWWEYLNPMREDYLLTVQLLSEDGQLLTQSDGDISGYPTSAWRASPPVIDTRNLTIPDDAPAGTYRVWVGWYRLPDFARLPVSHPAAANNLFPLPQEITIDR